VPRPAPHRARPVVALASIALLASAAGCSAAGTADAGKPLVKPATKPALTKVDETHHAVSNPNLLISPADGSTGVLPGQGITVTARQGKIEHVSVETAGDAIAGALGDGGKTWQSDWTLDVDQRYTVTATAINPAGHVITSTSTFSTVVPQQTFQTQIYEGYDLTYGVGMPIELSFTQPITDEAAVERSLQITTSKPVVGAWYWNGDQQVDFRPRTYWPAGTTVSFVGHLNGVEGANGVYGDHTLTQTFYIGPSLIVVASTTTHYMDVYEGGKLTYVWPISTGRPSLPTPNGTYVTIDKANPQLMVGPGYSLEVPWSVRFTLSGDFLHDAYWSVYEQGYENVSHGCVNMPPADAEIYYNMAVPGDPVTITGSPLGGTFNDGFTEWFLTWDQIVAGSALHSVVVAGPHGSYFAAPSSLPAVEASAPLETSPPNNSAAG
jgi:lipoprotein-anchoring transpeptidase ErfK/SrfK